MTAGSLSTPITAPRKFIFYELNASVLEEILLWLTRLKGDEQHVENP